MWHVASELVRTDRPTVLILPSDDLRDEAFKRLGDIPIVVGDPGSDETLLEAGIKRAGGVVVCMGNDKDNVLCVLSARQLVPKHTRIVAAVDGDETAQKLTTAGADAVVSPSRIGGLRMTSEMVRPKVVSFLDQMLRDDRALRLEEIRIPEDGSYTVTSAPSEWIGLTARS